MEIYWNIFLEPPQNGILYLVLLYYWSQNFSRKYKSVEQPVIPSKWLLFFFK